MTFNSFHTQEFKRNPEATPKADSGQTTVVVWDIDEVPFEARFRTDFPQRILAALPDQRYNRVPDLELMLRDDEQMVFAEGDDPPSISCELSGRGEYVLVAELYEESRRRRSVSIELMLILNTDRAPASTATD